MKDSGSEMSTEEADLDRRFGGLRRLYGDAGYTRIRACRVAVVGVGGVGSWAAEALARCGVAGLVLIDFDQVSESNINRQVQALGRSVGQAKVDALRDRIADIHPGCEVTRIEDFATPDNWPALLSVPVDALIDACDQGHAKVTLGIWALAHRDIAFVTVGAAGGKQLAQRVEVADLAEATHDPLLASMRQRLRKQGAKREGRIGVRCVFSRESVTAPTDAVCDVDSSLNCHGYGSSVMVTATFGLVAAGEAVRQCVART